MSMTCEPVANHIFDVISQAPGGSIGIHWGMTPHRRSGRPTYLFQTLSRAVLYRLTVEPCSSVKRRRPFAFASRIRPPGMNHCPGRPTIHGEATVKVAPVASK